MTAPSYALISALAIDRLPRAKLVELLNEVQLRPPAPGYDLPNHVLVAKNADQVRALRRAAEVYWDRKVDFFPHNATAVTAPPFVQQPLTAAQIDATRQTLTRGGPARITATEANAVLAAMPEVPQI